MATGNITRLEGVWPETHERAVRDSAGVNLETKLGNINSDISQLSQEVDEKADNRVGANIVNPSKVINGYLNTSGNVATNDGLRVTGYIPVSAGQSVQAFRRTSTSNSILCFAAYDANKTFVRGVTNSASYTQQDDEAYIRMTLHPSYLDSNYPTLFANYGNSLLPYEPYTTVKEALSSVATENKKASVAKNILMSDASGYNYVKCLKKAEVYVPDELKDHEYGISVVGFNTEYSRFYFRIYDITTGSGSAYIYRSYEEKPTSGLERISGFGDQGTMRQNGLYYIDIEVDWAEVDTYTDTLISGITLGVYPISAVPPIHPGVDNNYINSLLTVPDGTKLIGEGNTVIRVGTDGGLQLGSHCVVENIVFEYVGDNKITSRNEVQNDYIFAPILTLEQLEAGQNATFFGGHSNVFGIYIPMATTDTHVRGCQFLYFDKIAVYDGGNRHTNYNHSSVIDNMFVFCRTGLLVTEEFPRVQGNYFYGCLTGIYLNYGDTNIFGNNFIRCDCSIYMNTLQTAHGHIVSCHFAHSGLAGIYAKTIGDTVGMVISACQFAQAPIIAEYSVCMRIENCRLDTHFVISDGGKNSIVNNNMASTYAAKAGVENIFNVPEDTTITGNRALKLSENDALYNR